MNNYPTGYGLSDIDTCANCGQEMYELEHDSGYRYWADPKNNFDRHCCITPDLNVVLDPRD